MAKLTKAKEKEIENMKATIADSRTSPAERVMFEKALAKMQGPTVDKVATQKKRKVVVEAKASTSELDKLKERGLDEYNVAEAIMGFDSDVTSKLKIESGSELYASDELQKKYISGLDAKIKPAMFSGIKSIQVFDALEDENYHSLNNYLALKGYIKNEGNDAKKEYTESYRKNPDKFLNPALFEGGGEKKYQLYDSVSNKYMSRRLPNGNLSWSESAEMGYIYDQSEATDSMLESFKKDSGNDKLKWVEFGKKTAEDTKDDDKKAPETKKETPSCDELIDKFKVAKKARLERQKNKVEDTRKPETKLKDDAQKKVSSILDNIMKLSKKNKLSKRVKKDILAILKKGIDKAGKI